VLNLFPVTGKLVKRRWRGVDGHLHPSFRAGMDRIGPGQGGNALRGRLAPPMPMSSGRRFTRVASRAVPQIRLAKRPERVNNFETTFSGIF
jgi:hypothetical protein